MKTKIVLLLVFLLILTIVSPFVLTELTSLLFVLFPTLHIVGSIDSWIGFIGSILGSIITVLILYFTIIENDINRIRPSVIGELDFILEDRTKQLNLMNYINNYDFICWNLVNISQNVANGVKISDEHFEVYDVNLKKFVKYKDLYDKYGISMYTVLFEDYGILRPNGFEEMKTNISVDQNDCGEYVFNDVALSFKHILTISYTDITEKNKYKTLFEYEILINKNTENKLIFLYRILEIGHCNSQLSI